VPHSSSGFSLDEWAATNANHQTQFLFIARQTAARQISSHPPPCRYNRSSAISLGGTSALPLYAYRCTQCGHKFEKIQNFSADPETVCPQCGGVLERPLTAPRLNFKGAGWYINDYAPKSSSDTSSSESASSETKPAAKPETAAPAKSESSTPSPAPAAPASTPSSTT